MCGISCRLMFLLAVESISHSRKNCYRDIPKHFKCHRVLLGFQCPQKSLNMVQYISVLSQIVKAIKNFSPSLQVVKGGFGTDEICDLNGTRCFRCAFVVIEENAHHLFFSCNFARTIWRWFANLMDVVFDTLC